MLTYSFEQLLRTGLESDSHLTVLQAAATDECDRYEVIYIA